MPFNLFTLHDRIELFVAAFACVEALAGRGTDGGGKLGFLSMQDRLRQERSTDRVPCKELRESDRSCQRVDLDTFRSRFTYPIAALGESLLAATFPVQLDIFLTITFTIERSLRQGRLIGLSKTSTLLHRHPCRIDDLRTSRFIHDMLHPFCHVC